MEHYTRLRNVYGENALDFSSVRGWMNGFIEDNGGRPRSG